MYSQLISCGILLYFMGESVTPNMYTITPFLKQETHMSAAINEGSHMLVEIMGAVFVQHDTVKAMFSDLRIPENQKKLLMDTHYNLCCL